MGRVEEIEAMLAAITATLAAITPGEWYVYDRSRSWSIKSSSRNGTLADMRVYPGNGHDALFIASAPPNLRYLLDEVKRLRNAIEDHIAWAQGVTEDGTRLYEMSFSDMDELAEILAEGLQPQDGRVDRAEEGN